MLNDGLRMNHLTAGTLVKEKEQIWQNMNSSVP